MPAEGPPEGSPEGHPRGPPAGPQAHPWGPSGWAHMGPTWVGPRGSRNIFLPSTRGGDSFGVEI